jgi:hypothetical protein
VPNTPPPPVPLLDGAIDPDDPLRVRLTISVPAGATAPVALRLRRSRAGGTDPLGMPVVATATPGSWPATATDAGAAPWDPELRLAPWSTYTWRAEVQGAAEPGSTVPGAWSPASAPLSLRVLPPPPGPLVPGGAVPTAAGIVVKFTAGEPLASTPEGPYRIEVYRRLPAGFPPEESHGLGAFPAEAIRQGGSAFLVNDSGAEVSGTVYLAEIVDPLGRRGPRVAIATLP